MIPTQMTVSERFIREVDMLKANKIIKSMSEFASKVDISPQTLTEIRGGRQNVTTELLYKAIEAYPSFDIMNIFGSSESNAVVRDTPTIDPIAAMTQWMSKMEREISLLKNRINVLENNT